ncbi:A-kinase anchor protein 10, mitochondrial-like [Neovison vison]|uniref:A-kinase anchor protein 10, mitochondrial-like n=1 Tax=Neovison vison TaxID=452646 RepID=UPI001CF0CFAB|nr:A-kinase anchor protein 10, mitochondrial-like [Neogale vison]
MRGAGPSPRQSPRALRPDPGPAMSFFLRKVKGKEQEKTSDVKSVKDSPAASGCKTMPGVPENVFTNHRVSDTAADTETTGEERPHENRGP